jgi:hydroxyethylthiazole kinase-like uncharacterized protein yjeF
MKIFSTAQIREWDAYTIAHEPIRSIDLMERAAEACCNWITTSYPFRGKAFYVFCAKGNNGGDGLALARLLLEKRIPTLVYILEFGNKGTEDFQSNLERLHALTPEALSPEIYYIQSEDHFPRLPENAVIVDALLGSGLNRPLEGLTAGLVSYLDKCRRPVIAIDLPSGMRADQPCSGDPMVLATHTLTLGTYKLGLLLPENARASGEVHLLPIGLDAAYEAETYSRFQLTDLALVRRYFRPRSAFANKGNFGHALLFAGASGKMGACILASKACLRSGVGLLSCLVSPEFLSIIQISVPEAMALTEPGGLDPKSYKAFGIGPGIGTDHGALERLSWILDQAAFPVVIDADAINLLAKNHGLWEKVPPYSILTPHPKEFERLFGPTADNYAQLDKALEQSAERRCYIVLKGHRTFVACPDGSGYFNNTGNAGMATGGSGDVLTGILTGLLAQGYPPQHATVLGVYLHGLAGDLALSGQSMESLLSGDIAESLGAAFRFIAEEGK